MAGRRPAGLPQLVWLIGVELRNRVRRMAAQLRSARYLVAALVGVAYFALIFGPMLLDEGGARPALPPVLGDVAPLGLAVLVFFWWVRGGYQDALAFSAAEVHFLFPAPLRRRDLIRYKLLKSQVRLLFPVLFIWLFSSSGLPWYLTLPTLWVLIATLHMHQLGSSLVRVTASRAGRAGMRAVAAPVTVAVMTLAALGWTVASALVAFRAEPEIGPALAAGLEALRSPVARAVLYPFRAIVAPVMAADPLAWLPAILPAVILLGLHYAWVVRMDAAFEEAAAEAGRRQAEKVAALRSGQGWWRATRGDAASVRWVRIPLRSRGEPAIALLWRHMVAFTGDVRPATLLVVAGGLAAIFSVIAWGSESIAKGAVGTAAVCAMVAVFLLLIGPIATRYDLRRDLEMIAALRTYPISSRWLVAAEVAAPTLLLAALQYGLLLVCLALLPLMDLSADARLYIILATAALAALSPGLVALQVTIQNGMALLFPGWVRIGAGAGGGLDALGQHILSFLAATLLFFTLLIPPGLAAGLIGVSFAPALHAWAVAPAAAAFVASLWAQIALLVRWLASRYDRLDPVAAGLLR